MRGQVKLSVGDYWEYEKGFRGTGARLISRFEISGTGKIEGVECFIFEWEERAIGGNRLAGGRYWVETKTDRFARAERTFFDISGKMLQTETFGRSELKNWGIKGHARVFGPLKIGKTWSWKHRKSRSQVSVTRREMVEVPAGKFDCYLIETRVYENGLKFAFRSWYSTELGIIVRSSSHDPKGREMGFTELVRYLFSQKLTSDRS